MRVDIVFYHPFSKRKTAGKGRRDGIENMYGTGISFYDKILYQLQRPGIEQLRTDPRGTPAVKSIGVDLYDHIPGKMCQVTLDIFA